MKNTVSVWFSPAAITVDGEIISFTSNVTIDLIANNLPDDLDPTKISGINWNVMSENKIYFMLKGGSVRKFDFDKYNDYIQPYVDIWQAEKDRLDQEEQNRVEEYNKFENRQARALTQLNQNFETAKQIAHLKSSLGFTIDANQTANENVTGLLVTIGDGTTQFCDYNNVFHEVNKADLETMQTEIIQNAQYLYQQKWGYRTQIEECTDGDGLDEILAKIEFKYKDFTQ